MFGKIIGGALKAIGLEKLAPFVSVAINAFTGNWAGVAMDVAGLAARLTNNKFLSKVASLAPIASSFTGGSFNISDIFKDDGLKTIFNNFKDLTEASGILEDTDLLTSTTKITKAFGTVQEFFNDQEFLNNRISDSQRQLSYGCMSV
jgi:hypothetical protein